MLMSKRLLIQLELELEKENLETEDSDLEEDLWLYIVELMFHYLKL